MKELPKKELPEVSGGGSVQGGCVPQLPVPEDGLDYPQNPFNPVFEAPCADLPQKP